MVDKSTLLRVLEQTRDGPILVSVSAVSSYGHYFTVSKIKNCLLEGQNLQTDISVLPIWEDIVRYSISADTDMPTLPLPSNLIGLGILPRQDIDWNTFSYFLVSFRCRFVEAFCAEINSYFPDEWSNDEKADRLDWKCCLSFRAQRALLLITACPLIL